MTSSSPLSALGLRAFPPEIREMIFEFSNVLSWTGKAPALIVAMRGDQVLYQEVLDMFYKKNTFKLHRGNEWKTRDMTISALQSIRSLEVDFWSSDDWEEWDTAQIIEPSTHDFHHHAIMHATSTVALRLNVSAMSEYNMKACLLPAVTCALQLPHLSHITVDLPRITSHRSDDPFDKTGSISDLVRDFNCNLGCTGRLVAVGTDVRQVWFWEGEEGSALGRHVRDAMREWDGVGNGSKAGLGSACWTQTPWPCALPRVEMVA